MGPQHCIEAAVHMGVGGGRGGIWGRETIAPVISGQKTVQSAQTFGVNSNA